MLLLDLFVDSASSCAILDVRQWDALDYDVGIFNWIFKKQSQFDRVARRWFDSTDSRLNKLQTKNGDYIVAGFLV